MPVVRGRSAVKRFVGQLPREIETKVLRGAARAAATVIADEAKARSISPEVASAVKVTTKREAGRIIAKVQVKGEGSYIAPWLEYGTAPHFITVDESVREGRSAGRINRVEKQAAAEGRDGPARTLVINGKPIGTTVHHPGARPHPFLRPALDDKEAEAIAAAQAYIDARIRPDGIVDNGGPPLEDDE